MADDPETRALFVRSARRDPRFYISTFCFTSNTRSIEPVQPFILYPYEAFLSCLIAYNTEMSKHEENIYRRWDIGIDKSRDMGVTWTVLATIDWQWRFDKSRDFLTISRSKDLVDGSARSLLTKLDFIEERLPVHLSVRGPHHDHDHGRPNYSSLNYKNQCRIEGDSSHPETGRAGRYLNALRDEEAAAPHGAENTRALNQTTRCQIRVSTPNGIGNSFHVAKVKGGIDWITLHWSLHPVKSRGLYSVKNGRAEVIDKDWHNAHPGYKFRLTSTYADPGAPWEYLRSPWFDGEVDAADSIYDIQQEIQISYLGTGAPWFRADLMAALIAKHVREPVQAVDPEDVIPGAILDKWEYEDRDPRLDKLKLWCPINALGLPPQITTYSIGIDVGTGNGGASDSCIAIGDDKTKEKVAQFRSNGITPEDFSRVCLAFYEWFITPLGRPFMAWDAGGPGGPFGTKIVTLPKDFAVDVYYALNRDEKKAKRSKRPGVFTNGTLKRKLFTEYRDALYHGDFQTPDEDSYAQCAQFVHDGRGGVVHVGSTTTEDKAETGDQHGDVATSEAVLVRAQSERPPPIPIEPVIPRDCLAARIRDHQAALRAAKKRWYNMTRAA